MSRARLPGLACLLLVLGACGYRGPLTRVGPEGAPLAREERARQAAQTEAALAIAPQARPIRVDEPLRQGTERPEDPFASVPPGVALPPLPEGPVPPRPGPR